MFGEWIMKIIGLGALGVLLDVVLPEGETNKYIKGIFGIITVFVLFSPLPKLINADIKVDNLTFDSQSVEIDDNYTYYVYSKRWDEYSENLSRIYSEKFSTECSVDIKFVESCPEKVDTVFIYFKNLGIEEIKANKYRVEVVQDIVGRLQVEDRDVVVRYE